MRMRAICVILLMIVVLVFVFFSKSTRREDFNRIDSQAAHVGIEAGINACLIQGLPHSQEELDGARLHARRLIEKVYPGVKWQWPALKTDGTGTKDL